MAIVSRSLDAVPQEVLEHIAFYTATESCLGPPSSILPLLLINRAIYSRLSIAGNHHLYARVFAHQFDIAPAIRRLGPDRTVPSVLASELQRRWFCLKRIRARIDAFIPLYESSASLQSRAGEIRGLLFHAYLLMLENEGKNERQLRDYARMDDWLRAYWFDPLGASRALSSISDNQWPVETLETSLAMWLFWFLLRPDDYTKDDPLSWDALQILKLYALAAHKYHPTSASWTQFSPEPPAKVVGEVNHYSAAYRLAPSPLATPAILSFLTLVNKTTEGAGYSTPLPHVNVSSLSSSYEWECEWGRCLTLGHPEQGKVLTDSFRPGSIEGVWEGLFTYTEFTAYAALLGGAPPSVLRKSMVVRHRQTWKLREYHFIGSDPNHSDSGIDMDCDSPDPLPGGDPLRSYFPTGAQIHEDHDGVTVQLPDCKDTWRYRRSTVEQYPNRLENSDCTTSSSVIDIIITGEGHSSWGQFNVIGRVRPCDGFVSLSKEYVDGDRGKWLYRGYLVGNVNGNLAGRWRDTLSPAEAPGYEGCFAMSRRR